MKFRRIDELPPYVFATVDQLKRDLRREGRDVIDLGFGNPDIPSPAIAVSKLQEAAAKPANHRYSASRGITQLRLALTEHYQRSFGVALDPETQVTTTIGAKEGLAHLMWVLAAEGDTVVVPTPAYPIHRVAPALAGARVVTPPADGGIDAIAEAVAQHEPKVAIVSFPHNPTARVARAGWNVEPPLGTMFVWAPIPDRFRELGSLEFALLLAREANVAVSPGIGFGDGGDGHVRFALVENEQRIRQATRSIARLFRHAS